jgi:transcriptional regulator with XRE-family HTH domain
MSQEGQQLRTLGRWLAVARARAGLTQQQLAARCDTDQSTVSRLELGERTPTITQTLALANALNVPLQWFLNGQVGPNADLPDLALELRALGVVDLMVRDEAVPGAFRPVEQVMALAVRGDRPDPRIVEAMPAVLAWNGWHVPLLRAYADLHDRRARFRLAWLADVALTIHQTQGFPGGFPEKQHVERYLQEVGSPSEEDSLGHPATGGRRLPVWKRWKITYAGSLASFRDRAEHLSQLRAPNGRAPLP